MEHFHSRLLISFPCIFASSFSSFTFGTLRSLGPFTSRELLEGPFVPNLLRRPGHCGCHSRRRGKVALLDLRAPPCLLHSFLQAIPFKHDPPACLLADLVFVVQHDVPRRGNDTIKHLMTEPCDVITQDGQAIFGDKSCEAMPL